MLVYIVQKDVPEGFELFRFRRPFFKDVVARFLFPVPKTVTPRNGRINGYGTINTRLGGEFDILIKDRVIELPRTRGGLNPINHRALRHERVIRPGRMHGIGRDVLAASRRVQVEMPCQQSFMFFRPGLQVEVRGYGPGILPEIEPEFPIAWRGKGSFLNMNS